jgi:NADH:ubiquinone oxidoreductase subunit 6 (subunit J)
MKAAGFLLLFAGFAIVMSAFVMLPTNAPRSAFVLAGIAVQILGLGLAFRSHMTLEGPR